MPGSLLSQGWITLITAVRPTVGQRSLTLYSAVPIRSGDRILGAVVVSQSTFRILQALYDVRLRMFEIVVSSSLESVSERDLV